jgi:hypothetical protein
MSCCEDMTEELFDTESELYEARDRVRELEAAMRSMLELFESRGQHAAGDMVNMINRAMDK